MPELQIRDEAPQDHAAIYELTQRAFEGRPYAGGDEQDVVNRLRDQGALQVSLVAVEGLRVVGQITFSPAICSDGTAPWFALGPVSVEPDCQSRGIGSLLINRGLDIIRADGALGCILTGNPEYYQRFGFVVSPSLAPDNEPGEFFMVKYLAAEAAGGQFTFHPAFYGDH